LATHNAAGATRQLNEFLIAATAPELGRAVVTGNEKHLSRIGALATTNWTI
jgi:predicted nucleic acid-binding protein